MSEFTGPVAVTVNGREKNGRTVLRDDGTFEALDLRDVLPGQTVIVVTGEGEQRLTKTEAGDQDSPLDNWRLGAKAVRITLGEPSGKGGADFIHHGIVLREQLSLRVVEVDSPISHIVRRLGVIGCIAGLTELAQVDNEDVLVLA